GALAVACTGLDAPRLGVLPSFWWLAVLVGVGVAIALVLKPRPRDVALLWLSALVILPWIPWLPLSLTTALLVFAGRLRIFIWLAIATGLFAPIAITIVRSRRLTIARDARGAPWAAALVAALVYLLAAWSLSARLPDCDEPHYLVIAQ